LNSPLCPTPVFCTASKSGKNERTGAIMATTRPTAASARQAGLLQMLLDRRQEIWNDVQCRIHDVRVDGPKPVLDAGDDSEVDSQDDIEIALIQMKAETLDHIEEALVQLGAGEYGRCVECGEEISEQRLRALLFAVRCTTCADRREQNQARQQRLAERTGGPFLFGNMVRY
jgi:DnaK suppressor protein